MIIDTACEHCGEKFQAHSFQARYCSDSHRKAASRKRAREAKASAAQEANPPTGDTPHSPSEPAGSVVFDATMVELQAVGLERTAMGLALLTAARRVDGIGDEPAPNLASILGRYALLHDRTIGSAVPTGDAGQDEVAKARKRRDDARAARTS